jgi:hypothetical protein
MFVDTGVTTFLQALFDRGAQRRSLTARIAGGAHLFEDASLFNVGERNHTMVRKVLWKNNIMVSGEDVGGNIPRTMSLEMSTGILYRPDSPDTNQQKFQTVFADDFGKKFHLVQDWFPDGFPRDAPPFAIEQPRLIVIRNLSGDAIDHHQRIHVRGQRLCKRNRPGFAAYVTNLDKQWFCADGHPQTCGHLLSGFGMVIKLSIGTRDVRAGEVCLDAIRTALHCPRGALGEVRRHIIQRPILSGRGHNGDGEDFVPRQLLPRTGHISPPGFR